MKNKILSILLSVAIALGLWIYVITVVDPEYVQSYKVPVDPRQFQYYSVMEDRNLLIMEHEEYVTVKLKGNRSMLASIKGEDLTLQASLANVTKPGEYPLEYSVNIPGAILVEEQKPDTIYIRVDDKVTKELEIKADIVGDVPENFSPDTTDIYPDLEKNTISVVGPNSVVKNIAYAKLDSKIDLNGKTEDVIGEYELVLCNSAGKPVDAEGVTILGAKKVAVRVRIEMFKDIKLDFDIKEGGGLTRENVTWEHETIRISGPKALIEALGDTLVLGELDLATLQVGQEILPFKIDLNDDRLINRSGIEEVAVTVDFGKLMQREMTLREQNFDIRFPEGLSVDLDIRMLKVTLRGTADQLNKITEENIKVILDYSQATAGTGVACIPQVVINGSGFQDVVGFVDEVTATIK